MQRKDSLHALAERHFAHRERGVRAAPVLADDRAFEHLNALLVSFAHFHVHAHGVARPHRRTIHQVALLDGFDRFHDSHSSCVLPIPEPTWAPRRVLRTTLASRLLKSGRPTPAAPRWSTRRLSGAPAGAEASVPRAGAVATARSRRDGPRSTHPAPPCRGTPPAACTADGRAVHARTNPRRPIRGARRRPASTGRS